MKSSAIFFVCIVVATFTAQAFDIKDDTKICGVCSQPVHVKIAISIQTVGSRDLDLRPAPELRDTLKYQIQYCPKCGYCWPDIAKERKREKIDHILNQPIQYDDIAALFARAAAIEIADNAPSFASFMLFLKAAWVCDDLKNKRKSDDYRRLASHQMDLYMERDAIARTTGDNYLTQVDVVRRIGDFDKARRLLAIADLYAKESILPLILAFQKKLVENKDTGRYTVADVLTLQQ
ncbi:MAG: DUF2225 domain-containing protein [Lentisphaeria bacterium]|nr:DUF2225 domain-containing protein [Victivallales bacterium]MBR6056559.1 DUF2225 domain-containing protein [Victivallales bacterium]MCR4575272.1 DUF2225 domain-containing protein [Lentisphaeria bacterium]